MADTSLPLKKEEHPYAKLLADPIRHSSQVTGESLANVQARITFPSLTDMFKVTPVDEALVHGNTVHKKQRGILALCVSP